MTDRCGWLMAHDPDLPPLQHLLVEIDDNGTVADTGASRIVFLVTKNHPERLRVTLPAIAASADRVYVLDSSTNTETRALCADAAISHVCYHGPQEQEREIGVTPILQRALRSGFITLLAEDRWDIWSKRNYALLHARLHGYSRILLIDDDVVATPTVVASAIGLAGVHKLVGARIRGMPDVSVAGHLMGLAGVTSQHFISGHFLALDVEASSQFYFADIYNEDWLFILLNSISWPVGRHGTIFQMYWNPYNGSEARAVSEEFGEVIVEGVARALLADRATARLDQLEHWHATLEARRRMLDAVAARAPLASMPACLSILCAIQEASSTFTAEGCLEFWKEYQARLPEWRAQVAEARAAGVHG
jgi:hypothetical protein